MGSEVGGGVWSEIPDVIIREVGRRERVSIVSRESPGCDGPRIGFLSEGCPLVLLFLVLLF